MQLLGVTEYEYICMRCGSCCKGQHCRVPKYAHSDLSPAHLGRVLRAGGQEALDAYVREHSVWQGDRCPWLKDNADRTTTCTAYGRRSATCRDYNTEGGCKIWMQIFGLV